MFAKAFTRSLLGDLEFYFLSLKIIFGHVTCLSSIHFFYLDFDTAFVTNDVNVIIRGKGILIKARNQSSQTTTSFSPASHELMVPNVTLAKPNMSVLSASQAYDWVFMITCPLQFVNHFQIQKLHLSFTQSHHQLQDTLDVDLVTQAHVHTCLSTYSKVIISCRTH